MKKLTLLLLSLAFLAGFAFILWQNGGNRAEHDRAIKALLDGDEATARAIYRETMAKGDKLSANNLYVLEYREARYSTKRRTTPRVNANRKYRDLFEQLGNDGLAVGTYNRALFEFRCAVRQECYATGKARFLKAQKQGDNLAAAGFAQTLSYTEPAGDPERAPLLKAAADAGNPHAAYTYAKIAYSTDKLEGQRYARKAAEAGLSHGQEYYATYHKGETQQKWLEMAATNPKNPRRQAAKLLGYNFVTGANGFYRDHAKARYWLKQTMIIDTKYLHPLIIRRDGLRWRDIGTGFNSGKSTPGFAAYDLALLQFCGFGGPVDLNGFGENMRKAAQSGTYNSKEIIAKPKQARALMNEQINKRSYDIRPIFETCLQ